MPHPVRGLASTLVSEIALAESWSGVFDVPPPVPPATLRETTVARTFLWRAGENDERLWTDPTSSPFHLAHGTLHYALAPAAEPAAPPPTRFHTVALIVNLEGPSPPSAILPLCYDTEMNDRPMVGHFEVSRFPFFPPIAFPFPAAYRVSVLVSCENDTPGVTYTQEFAVSWRKKI